MASKENSDSPPAEGSDKDEGEDQRKRSVLISNIPRGTDIQQLMIYFQRESNGGGEVDTDNSKMLKDGKAVIVFDEEEVAHSVLQREHTFEGTLLHLEPLFKPEVFSLVSAKLNLSLFTVNLKEMKDLLMEAKKQTGVKFIELCDGFMVSGSLEQIDKTCRFLSRHAKPPDPRTKRGSSGDLENGQHDDSPLSDSDDEDKSLETMVLDTEPKLMHLLQRELNEIEKKYKMKIDWKSEIGKAHLSPTGKDATLFDQGKEEFISLYQKEFQDLQEKDFPIDTVKKMSDLEMTTKALMQEFAVVIEPKGEMNIHIFGKEDDVLQVLQLLQAQYGKRRSRRAYKNPGNGELPMPDTHAQAAMLPLSKTLENGVVVSVHQGDITKAQVEVIVNAANERLEHGGGVAGAIVKQGGRQIQQESNIWIQKSGRIPVGQVAHTGAGNLPCKRIIHAVGPQWKVHGEERSRQHIFDACRNSFNLASRNGISSIALPGISSGLYGVPKEICSEMMFIAAESFAVEASSDNPLQDIRFINIDTPTYEAFRKEFLNRYGEDVEVGSIPNPEYAAYPSFDAEKDREYQQAEAYQERVASTTKASPAGSDEDSERKKRADAALRRRKEDNKDIETAKDKDKASNFEFGFNTREHELEKKKEREREKKEKEKEEKEKEKKEKEKEKKEKEKKEKEKKDKEKKDKEKEEKDKEKKDKEKKDKEKEEKEKEKMEKEEKEKEKEKKERMEKKKERMEKEKEKEKESKEDERKEKERKEKEKDTDNNEKKGEKRRENENEDKAYSKDNMQCQSGVLLEEDQDDHLKSEDMLRDSGKTETNANKNDNPEVPDTNDIPNSTGRSTAANSSTEKRDTFEDVTDEIMIKNQNGYSETNKTSHGNGIENSNAKFLAKGTTDGKKNLKGSGRGRGALSHHHLAVTFPFGATPGHAVRQVHPTNEKPDVRDDDDNSSEQGPKGPPGLTASQEGLDFARTVSQKSEELHQEEESIKNGKRHSKNEFTDKEDGVPSKKTKPNMGIKEKSDEESPNAGRPTASDNETYEDSTSDNSKTAESDVSKSDINSNEEKHVDNFDRKEMTVENEESKDEEEGKGSGASEKATEAKKPKDSKVKPEGGDDENDHEVAEEENTIADSAEEPIKLKEPVDPHREAESGDKMPDENAKEKSREIATEHDKSSDSEVDFVGDSERSHKGATDESNKESTETTETETSKDSRVEAEGESKSSDAKEADNCPTEKSVSSAANFEEGDVIVSDKNAKEESNVGFREAIKSNKPLDSNGKDESQTFNQGTKEESKAASGEATDIKETLGANVIDSRSDHENPKREVESKMDSKTESAEATDPNIPDNSAEPSSMDSFVLLEPPSIDNDISARTPGSSDGSSESIVVIEHPDKDECSDSSPSSPDKEQGDDYAKPSGHDISKSKVESIETHSKDNGHISKHDEDEKTLDLSIGAEKNDKKEESAASGFKGTAEVGNEVHRTNQDGKTANETTRFTEDLSRDEEPGSLRKADSSGTSTSVPTSKEYQDCGLCRQKLDFEGQASKICDHLICKNCVTNFIKTELSNNCPICHKPAQAAPQPLNGQMKSGVIDGSLPGHGNCATLYIDYDFPEGIQGPFHPNPGSPYDELSRRTFLPNNEEGREVLKLLQKAFDACILFTVGKSTINEKDNQIIFNADIEQKVNVKGGPTVGYPDPEYLDRVKKQLKAKGIE